MSRVRSQPLLDQKRDLDFRFAAQMSRGTSRGFRPPSLLIRGLAVANLGPANTNAGPGAVADQLEYITGMSVCTSARSSMVMSEAGSGYKAAKVP
jgi:hypothetical protein